MIKLNREIDFSKIRLLIFDLDGTLIDSRQDLVNSSNHLRAVMARPPLDDTTISSYVGDGARFLVRRLLDGSADEALVDRGLKIFLEYYRQHMLDHTVLYPGVLEALNEIKLSPAGSARTMTVLTNKPVRFSRLILEGLGVANHFRSIYGGNSFEQKKPDPMGCRIILEETGIAPEAALMVGDSDVDILTGRNADIATCGVTYGLGLERMKATPPDVQVDDLRELAALLNGRPPRLAPPSNSSTRSSQSCPETAVSD
ncbi:MAG: HAD-IA family hydrolase [Acidobacteriia bacterium]|nr:HAD-IA family hydrolase [Terriglobia bacterium]